MQNYSGSGALNDYSPLINWTVLLPFPSGLTLNAAESMANQLNDTSFNYNSLWDMNLLDQGVRGLDFVSGKSTGINHWKAKSGDLKNMGGSFPYVAIPKLVTIFPSDVNKINGKEPLWSMPFLLSPMTLMRIDHGQQVIKFSILSAIWRIMKTSALPQF